MSGSSTPFREASIDDITAGETNEDTNLLEHFENLPKSARLHEDFECLIGMVRMLWNNKLFLEHRYDMTKMALDQHIEANTELNELVNRLGRQLVNQDRSKSRLNSLIETYRTEFNTVVADVTLNEKTYSVNRGHLRQIFQWYAWYPLMVFSEGDTIDSVDKADRGAYMFTLGEFVKRRYKDHHSREYMSDEVIIFCENKHMVHIVSDEVLERGGKDDSVAKPLMIWKNNVEALMPRRYFMTRDALIRHLNIIFGTNDSTEEA